MRVFLLLVVVFAALCACAQAETTVLSEAEIDDIASAVPLPPSDLEAQLNIEGGAYRVGEGREAETDYARRYRQALQLMEDHQFQAAIKILRDYVANHSPTAFPANRQLARALWLDGKLTEAAFWFGRVLFIAEAGHSVPHLRVAYGLWAEYLTDIAHNWSSLVKEELKSLLEQRSQDVALYPLHSSIDVFIEADKEDIISMADAFYEKAVAHLDREDKYHFQQWALAMGTHGRHKKAVKIARKALDAPMNPQQPAYDEDVYKMLADFHRSQRKFEKCLKFGNSALALSAIDVIFVMSDCYLGLHKPDAAMKLLTDSAEEYPFLKNEILYGAYIAQVLAFQGKNEEAVKHYREALELSTDENLQGTLYIALAKLEDSMGDYEQAHNDYSIGTELLYDRWIYRNYKPRWELGDKSCPRRRIHNNHVTDFNIITSRNLIHGGNAPFGKQGSTPLAAPGLAEKAGWEQRQELFFEDRSVHQVQVPNSAVFGASSLNMEQCGLLLGFPSSLAEANSINKLISTVEKGVFLGPGGSFSDLSWLLLHKVPQLLLLKEAKAFSEGQRILAPATPLVNELCEVFGLEQKIFNFEPMVTSVLASTVDMMEFSNEDSGEARPFEDAQFVSQWAIAKTRKALLPEGDLEKSQRNNIVVIKSVPKNEIDLTIARQVDLHEALKELGEVVVFNPHSTTLTLAKIKAAFQSASVIVGPHSPGLTGMLFAAPGTPVVELPVQGGSHNLYANLATALDLPYWIVPTCQSPRLGEYDISDSQIAEVVETVRLALAGEGGVQVPLFVSTESRHDEL